MVKTVKCQEVVAATMATIASPQLEQDLRWMPPAITSLKEVEQNTM